MKTKNDKSVKLNSVPPGKACLAAFYIGTFVIAIMGTVKLFDGDDVRIGIAIWAIALFVFIPIIILMHYNNCADSILFFDDKIKGKRKTLTWDTACLTVHCHRFLASRTVFAWLYFDDHYLSKKEIFSWRIRRQGLCIRLNYKIAQFVLARCNSKIEVLNEQLCNYSDLIFSIYMHNDRVLSRAQNDDCNTEG